MTCRHEKGDPTCTSQRSSTDTPDANNYEIEKFQRFGEHLVLQVKYPNCSKCAYEGSKVMVFFNVKELEVLKWRSIDPHFREPSAQLATQAPSPDARFPASKEGWSRACAWTRSMANPPTIKRGE